MHRTDSWKIAHNDFIMKLVYHSHFWHHSERHEFVRTGFSRAVSPLQTQTISLNVKHLNYILTIVISLNTTLIKCILFDFVNSMNRYELTVVRFVNWWNEPFTKWDMKCSINRKEMYCKVNGKPLCKTFVSFFLII